MRAILGFLGVGLLCGTAFAADPPAPPVAPPSAPITPQAPPPLDDTTGSYLAILFTDFCYHAFPDDAALDAKLLAKGAVVMTPEQVKGILHDDPGRGWIYTEAGHRYLVTVEAPPFHACSVRVNTPAGVSTSSMSQMLPDLIEGQGQHAGKAQSLNRDTPLQIRAMQLPLMPAPPGAQAESFMSFVTTYRDKTSNAVLTVENRFVRQIYLGEPPTAPVPPVQ